MRKYKVGVVGMGQIGKVHIEALNKLNNIIVTAVTSRTDVVNRAKVLGVNQAFTCYKEMIDNVNLDAIHICTTNNTHYDIAKYAIINGLHVVLEKPMTMNVKEAKELYDLSIKHEVVTAINFHNRFYPINMYMHNNINQLGDIIAIHGAYLQDWITEQTSDNWRTKRANSGLTRVVADVGTHILDLIEFTSNHKIENILARFKQIYPTRNDIEIDTEDIATVMFETNKGAIGTLMISQSHPGFKNNVEFTLAGKKASFISDGSSVSEFTIGNYNKANEKIKVLEIDTLRNGDNQFSDDFILAFRELFRQFYFKIDNKGFKYDFADFGDGLHSMKLIEAIYESNKQSKWIKIKD